MGCAASTSVVVQESERTPSKKDVQATLPRDNGTAVIRDAAPESTVTSQTNEYIGSRKPENEEGRMATLSDLSILNTEPEKRFDDITKLCTMIFSVPICLVSLVDSERQWFKSKQGLPANETDRRSSFCAWTLLPSCPTILVVENALEDPRFNNNPLVVGFPHIRFYAGTPLVASNGHRLGSLCVIDRKPSKFTTEQCTMLANFGEMVVREIERDKKIEMQRLQNESLAKEQTRLVRAMDSISEAIMLVDLSSSSWPVLFVNESMTRASGVMKEVGSDEEGAVGFWDQFVMQSAKDESIVKARQAYSDAILEHKNFNLTVKVARGAKEGESLHLQFRSANSSTLDSYMPAISIPAIIQDNQSGGPVGGPCYYYVTLRTAASMAKVQLTPLTRAIPSFSANTSINLLSTSDNIHSSANNSMDSGRVLFSLVEENVDPFGDVKFGPLLGHGSFGRVYRGQWNGAQVAVKVLEHYEKMAQGQGDEERGTSSIIEADMTSGALMEALLTSQVSHPNVVRTFKHCTRPMKMAARMYDDDNGEKLVETWMIMEFCDRGTLSDAVDCGTFRDKHSLLDVDYSSLLSTATEVAGAMSYLHSLGVMHGDLTGGNILLCSSQNQRKFVAKVADFGFSRILRSDKSPMMTQTYGAVSHTAPELLLEGKLSKSCDVYSFGVLVWEIYSGERPYHGLTSAQIINHVSKGRGLTLSAGCPPPLRKFIQRCCSHKREERPTFAQILEELQELEEELV